MKNTGNGLRGPSLATFHRRTPSGRERRWKVARLGPRNPLPVFFIQHITPLAERRPAGAGQPNGVYRTERAYIAVSDLAAAVDTYSRVLGMAKPPIERGTVIMAEMAVFQLGASGLTLAHPHGPGACADALSRRGPGPFQVLYRTKSMDAAARWLSDHGVPPPARGRRLRPRRTTTSLFSGTMVTNWPSWPAM